MTVGRRRPNAPSPAVWRSVWPILLYTLAAYWITQRVLFDWVTSADTNFFLIQPVIWLGLAAMAYAVWRRLPSSPTPRDGWMAVAIFAGSVHVAVIVGSGLIGGQQTIRGEFDWLVYVENTWYAGTLLIGIEMARTVLFHKWVQRHRTVAWAATVIVFFVVATPYAQFEALGTRDQFFEVVGGSLIPALAISVLATWFAEQGDLRTSLVYRAPIVAYVWYSRVVPDLHWSTALAVGVAAPVLAWTLARALAPSLTRQRAYADGQTIS